MNLLILKKIMYVCSLIIISTNILAEDVEVEINVVEDYEAGTRLANNGNHEFAIKIFEQCAKKENPRCYFALGTYYYNGDGGKEQDLQKAFEYFKLGADGNYGYSEFTLGMMYLRGEAIEKNEQQGLEYISYAAHKCVPQAQMELASYLISLKGYNEMLNATAWLNLASSNGHDEATEVLDAINSEMDSEFKKEATRLQSLIEKDIECQQP